MWLAGLLLDTWFFAFLFLTDFFFITQWQFYIEGLHRNCKPSIWLSLQCSPTDLNKSHPSNFATQVKNIAEYCSRNLCASLSGCNVSIWGGWLGGSKIPWPPMQKSPKARRGWTQAPFMSIYIRITPAATCVPKWEHWPWGLSYPVWPVFGQLFPLCSIHTTMLVLCVVWKNSEMLHFSVEHCILMEGNIPHCDKM